MEKRALPLRSMGLLALAVGIIACSNFESSKVELKTVSDRKPAPEFALKDATGATLRMSDLKGKVVLVNFWATWCGPCKIEIPWFMEFQRTYKDKDFAVVGISLDEDGWTSVKPYIEEKKMNYRVVVGDDEISRLFGKALPGAEPEPGQKGGEAAAVDNLPTTFIVDREGRIASTHVGLVSKATYEKEIKSLLEDGGIRQVARN